MVHTTHVDYITKIQKAGTKEYFFPLSMIKVLCTQLPTLFFRICKGQLTPVKS